MRIGGYDFEMVLSVYGFLSVVLLTTLWFLAIFAFRVALAFIELLPYLGSLEPTFQLSPRIELLTWQMFITSLLPALVLGPITHLALTGAAASKVFEAAALEEESAAAEDITRNER